MTPRLQPAWLRAEPHHPRREQSPGSAQAWPGADPALGPSLFLDQLAIWDAIAETHCGPAQIGPRFRAEGCRVRLIPARGSKAVLSSFLAAHHYSEGPGMRGLAFGLYRDDALLGTAVYSRVCRPRWAGENFRLLPEDRRRSPVQRRHLSVTEAEYAALSRFALAPDDADGRCLGNGAATWFLSRTLAGLEARNRALWSAHQRLFLGARLTPEQRRLIRAAARADAGLGRGYIKAVTTWADPWENMVGHIYQVLRFHYTGRTNRGRWRKETVGLRSNRRLSARTLAKARAAKQPGHVHAALRLAWEGGDVCIEVKSGSTSSRYEATWVASLCTSSATEPEITGAIATAWTAWSRVHVPAGAAVALHWAVGTGVRQQTFPPKHAYLTGLGSSPWYRRQTEIRHRPLTERLLAEAHLRSRQTRERRVLYYPRTIPPHEIRPELRPGSAGSCAA